MSPLRSPTLRRILIAYTVNRLGTWLALVALMLAVYDNTHSAFAVAALLFSWQALPAFAVPAVVARVEASRRRRELTGLYLFEAAAIGTLAVLLSHFWLPAVLLIVALDGTAALAASALLRSEVARVARREAQLASQPDPQLAGIEEAPGADQAVEEAERGANAALNVAFATTIVIGPLIGGALVASDGAPTALLVDVGSFLICGALLVGLHPHVEEIAGGSVQARLRAAWRHINEAPTLRALLAVEAVALLFLESGGPIEVAYVKSTLHAGDRGLGVLLAAWGGGAVLGGLLFARLLGRSLTTMLGLGTLAVGIAYVGFALAPSLTVACLAAALGGVGQSLQWPSLISLVQRLTPPRLLGRLMAAVESLGAVCLAIGLVLGGALVALSTPRVAFAIVGLGAVATTGALVHVADGRADAQRDAEEPHRKAETRVG